MRNRLIILGGLASLAVMALFAKEEVLVKADGTVSAKVLPLDREFSTKKFETATFGLG